jgi:putative membrane protein
MRLLVLWIVNAATLMALPYVVPSIQVASVGAAFLAALVLGLINAVLRPILILLTLPVTLLTLGLFIFVINAALFQLVGTLIEGFAVGGFWSALLGSIVYSIISWVLSSLLLPRKED